MDITIYALKGSSEWFDILPSLQKGEGRFGWSYIQSADLKELKKRVDEKGWDALTDEEKDCYQVFLLDFKAGDYVVYINVPEWGKCTVTKVTGQYQWKFEDDDFNHRFPVDPSSVYVFDRNDASVHPALRSRLKLQGRWWRIYLKDEFAELLEVLKKGVTPSVRTPEANLRFLSNEIQPFLLNITQRIHHTHPNYDLECLLAEVFKKIPGVIDVKWQGGAGDHGADILVTFDGGLPIPGLEKQSVLVVQVKSYEGDHWDTRAVEDIKRAFVHYPEASMGLIISTANAITTAVEQELDKLKEESGKPVSILVGPDVAAFLLRYGAKLLA
ncbi:MAG: restriction endonuclease [Planctomycetota bacterium]|nr:restriction endonuclease [Planctomycetota bacterium]MDA1142624.1 restriction endonuclease [Planctomycetota bacterium]